MSADNSLCLPWTQTLLDDVMEITKTSVTNWCKIVTKTGLSETLRKEWSEIFINQVRETYKDMTDEAVENQNKIINLIEVLLKKSEVLCKDLHIRMPQYGSQQLSLYEEFQLLENRINEYEKMVQAQKKEIELLVKQQSETCKLLGWKEKSIPTSPLPSKEYLEEFKRYLDVLESTKFERTENFIITKNEIVTIVEELQYNPDLDFEKLVLLTDDEKFLITDDNMNRLADFYNSLKELKQKAKMEVANLRESLESLWNILNVDSSVREQFLSKYCGHSLNTLEALKTEIKRCEVLKKANIQKFVEKLRCDLAHLWEKCHATDLERENFIYFRVDHYTEDLLSLHDYEIKRLENYYKENQQLFTLIEKRKNLWEKMLRLEEKETASDRYKNRGGQLLQEERERKTLSKQIPSMEERMLELAAKYEEDNGTPFLSWGETIEAIVNRDHEEHNQNRRLKLSERKKIRDNTLTPRTNLGVTCSKSTQNLALATPKLTTTKRKLMGTPMLSSKRTRILEETNARTAPPKLKINDRTIKTPRFSTERAKREAKRRRLSQKSLKKRDRGSPVSSEYYSFERDVDSKDGCRSTMGPDVLAVPLAPTPQVAPSNLRSPRIAAKLSVAPMKLLF